MDSSRPSWITQGLALLRERRDLPPEVMAGAVRSLTSGAFDETEGAEFLKALAEKGESAAEIVAAASVLRERMVRIRGTGTPLLDTCGTGGDGSGTFNISTAVALVVAATGTPVVKHGNRSVSSRSGSADVLAALGVPVEKGPAWAQECLDRHGFAFCFAPHFHPALAVVATLRRKLGIRTVFNLIGPLLNPAAAEHQLLGVGRAELLDPLAGAAAGLGVRQTFLVCGDDGLDEVSLSAPTQVRRARDGHVEALVWTPDDFGLGRVRPDELTAGSPEESAAIIREIFSGGGGPRARVVTANAAAALLTAGRVGSLREGVVVADAALASGSPLRLLDRLRAS
jgi:anthranilate phosphoribosyltransferase